MLFSCCALSGHCHRCYTHFTVGQPRTAVKYRFGTFELDVAAAELRKRGVHIKLQEQPYRALCLLLDRPGDVVTRETLCSILWPKDTFVEFERSLNAAIAKLRQTLGDTAENPRFIETVARRGYRFIAPVQAEADTEPLSLVISQPAELPSPPPRLPSNKWKRTLAAAALAIIVLATIAVLRKNSGGRLLPELTRLTFDSGLTTEPTLSPDGKLLAYASDRPGTGRLHIWVQQFIPDGQAVQLTGGDFDDHQPAFSPDGSKLAFRSERNGGGIYVVPAVGGQAILIAKGGSGPRFSPDGRWIAYWQGSNFATPYFSNYGSVYLVPAAGGLSRPLPSDLTQAGVPVWSPDGKRLAVYGGKDNQTPGDIVWDWCQWRADRLLLPALSTDYETRVSQQVSNPLASPSGMAVTCCFPPGAAIR